MKFPSFSSLFGQYNVVSLLQSYDKYESVKKLFDSDASAGDRNWSLFTTPDVPFAYVYFDSTTNKCNLLPLHHPWFKESDQNKTKEAKEIFFLAGSETSPRIAKVISKDIARVDALKDILLSPSKEDLYSEASLHETAWSSLSKLQIQPGDSPVVSALFPIPPFAFEAFTKATNTSDISTVLTAFLSSLEDNEVQYFEDIGNKSIKDASLSFVRLLFALALVNDSPDSPTSAALKDCFPNQSPILEPADEPKEIADHYDGLVHDKIGSNDDNGNQSLVDIVRTLAGTCSQTVSATNRFAQQTSEMLRQSLELNNRARASTVDETPSSGFARLTTHQQRLFLRLAAAKDKIEATAASPFLTRFLASSKVAASSELQQAFTADFKNFQITKGVALTIHRGELVSDSRDHLALSLMSFMKAESPQARHVLNGQNLALEHRTATTEELIAISKLTFDFPDNVSDLKRGLRRMAHLFDTLGGGDSNTDYESYIGYCLRGFANDLEDIRDLIAKYADQDPDVYANICNIVDIAINEYMKDCRDTEHFKSRALNKLVSLAEDLKFSAPPPSAWPAELLKRIPSRNRAAPDNHNGSPQKKAKLNEPTGGNGGHGPRINPNFSADDKLPLTFRTVFPPGVHKDVPKVSVNGKGTPLCLKYFGLGKCVYPGCDKFHGTLNNNTKARWMAFRNDCITKATN